MTGRTPDAIVIGAGAGLSASAGFTYSGELICVCMTSDFFLEDSSLDVYEAYSIFSCPPCHLNKFH